MKPRVTYIELPEDQVQGRDFYQVIDTEEPGLIAYGETFSDDDLSALSVQFEMIEK